MTLKKSKVSNFIWVIYSVFALAFSALIFTKTSETLGYDDGIGLIFVPVILAVGVGIVVLVEVLRRKIQKQISINQKVALILPYALGAVLLGAGIWLRIRSMSIGAFDLREYYNNSIITRAPMFNSIHGASQFYYFFLRRIFMTFGNHYQGALVFQIACQTVAIIVLFFATKKICGPVHAIVVSAFFSLSPCMVEECLTLGPSVVFLLFICIDILIMSYALPFRKMTYIIAIITGIISGIIAYMDISSVILLLFIVLFFLAVKKVDNEDETVQKISYSDKKLDADTVAMLQDKTVALIIFAASCIAVLFICEIVDFAVSGLTFSGVIKAQLSNYKPAEFSLYSLYSSIDIISGSVLSIILIVAIPAGFIRKKSNQGTVIFGIALVLAVIFGFSMPDSSMNGSGYIFIALSFIAAETVYSIFVSADGVKKVVKVLDEEEALILEAEREKKRRQTVHKIEDGEMLANPLPVPVKKKKKKMEYEYFVPDDAEYDI